MQRFKFWMMIVLAALFALFVALQPAITYACVAAGSHGGC